MQSKTQFLGNKMKNELFWLSCNILLVATMWMPYVYNRVKEIGLPSMGWNPPPDPPQKAKWAARNVQAHINAIENIAIFAPLAIMSYFSGSAINTSIACAIYFFARLGHFIIMMIGAPIPYRTLIFLLGHIANLYLVIILIARFN